MPDASYTVHHAGGTTTIVANQKQNQGAWSLLGSYELDPGAGHKVVLAGNAAAGLNLVADAIRYVRIGDSLSVQADAVRFVPNNAESLLYVHADRLGTAQRITDQAGAVVWDAIYLPFGTAHSITGAVTYNQRFPGQYFDAETGLHYNYWRDYDPRIGRYLQADPIGLAGGVNRYAYVDGNPTRFADPRGDFAQIGLFLVRSAISTYGARIAAGLAAAVAALGPEPQDPSGKPAPGQAADDCPPSNGDCTERLSDWKLRRMGINAHELKFEVLGRRTNISRYEICRCKDGRIVVRAKGCTGPVIETGY